MIQEARGSCPVRSMLCLGSPEGLAGGVVAAVGAMYTRWRNAQPLELRGRFMSNGCTHVQRLYPSPTPAPRRRPPGQPLESCGASD